MEKRAYDINKRTDLTQGVVKGISFSGVQTLEEIFESEGVSKTKKWDVMKKLDSIVDFCLRILIAKSLNTIPPPKRNIFYWSRPIRQVPYRQRRYSYPIDKESGRADLEGELESNLGQEIAANHRNGKGKKTIKFLNGPFELDTPHDRAGSFSPKLIKKHQTTLSNKLEEKILALYGLGMSYKDLSSHLWGYLWHWGLQRPLTAISAKIIHTVKEWQALGIGIELLYCLAECHSL